MSLKFSNERGLHFVHLNTRSLWNKFDQVRQLLHDSNISVFGISESWLNENFDQRLIEIPQYSCIRNDRFWSENGINIKKGGGVCCYIKNSLIYSENEFQNFNKSTKNIEMQLISINQPHLKKIVLINLYRPPQGNTTEFCNTLHDTVISIDAFQNNEIEIFIMGDINYANPISPGYQDIKWFEQRTGLSQLITTTTRYSQNNSCIDSCINFFKLY